MIGFSAELLEMIENDPDSLIKAENDSNEATEISTERFMK